MSSTKFLKLKKRHLIYYSLADEKRYNQKSKENLVQFQNEIDIVAKKDLYKRFDKNNVECINKHTKDFILSYEQIMQNNYKRAFSITQTKKILDTTNTFIDVVKHNYKRSNGLKQRMITFVTLTIPQNQKHTDKVLVKTLIDFIDHLKKVKNYLIENKIQTKVELLKLENYVWRAETTESGNLHFHLLFDTYVNHITLKRVWNNYLEKLGYEGGQNAANIHNLQNIKDVGGYIGKYLTKEPLTTEFANLLKNKTIGKDDLKNYDPNIVFRRPILYTSWGCSRPIKKLTSPTFSGSHVNLFDELKEKCVFVELSDDLKDYVKIYKGKIYELLNTCTYNLKNIVRNKFKYLFYHIYNKSEIERKELRDLVWLYAQSKPINIFDNIITEIKKPLFYTPQLF